MKNLLSVSIIIPVFKDSKRLASCLESLCCQFSDNDDVEVIVVDNHGSLADELDESQFPNTQFIVETTPGSYAARNQGILHANGSWLVFTDADCLIVKGWWDNLKERLSKTDSEFLVGEVDVFPVVLGSPSAAEFYDMLFAFPIRELFERKGSGVTANLMARRECFDKYGKFDNRLFSGADNMWCRQAFAKGAKSELAEGLAVQHPARNSLKQLKTKVRRIAGGKAQRSTLHQNEPLPWIAVVRAFFPSIKQLKKIWGASKISVWLKIKTSFLASFLRFYRASYELCFKLGLLKSPERR